jgi:molybdate transport system ATP-binding protein
VVLKKNNHWAVFVSNQANEHLFIKHLLEGKAPEILSAFNQLKGALLSNISLNELIAEEERHEQFTAAKEANRNLRSLSSGEQKKSTPELPAFFQS